MKKYLMGVAGLLCMAQPTLAAPHFKHVVIVILENTEYDDAIKQPFFKKLASRGATLANYHAITHPSEPNYVALISGSTYGIIDDGKYDLDGKTVADILEPAHKTWKVYVEALPSIGFLGMYQGTYARKHEPFVSFKSITDHPARLDRIVPAAQLDKDIAAGQLPNYSLYIPDQNDDGHDTTIVYANDWLTKAFGARLDDARFMRDTLFVVTFDESNIYTGTNHVAAMLVGPSVKPHFVSNKNYTHFSLLRTVEDNFAVGTLGQDDTKANPIDEIWK